MVTRDDVEGDDSDGLVSRLVEMAEGGALAEQRSHLATFAELVKVTIPAHPLFATKQVSGAPFFIYWAGSSHNAKHRRRKCLHVGMFFWPEVATTNPRAPSEARRPLI